MATQIAQRGNRRTHVLLPNEVTGYAFDSAYSWWTTVVAEGSTNLLLNPSFELKNEVGFADEYDATGTWEEIGEANIIIDYPAVGAPAGRRVAQLVGATGSGTLVYTTLISVTPGAYTFSLDLYVDDTPARVTLAVMNVGVVVASRSYLISNKGWQRLHLTYTEQATTTRTLRLSYTNAGPHTVTMYTDAWQFERKPYPTTYLDGDAMGFNDILPYTSYFWHGAPHASASTRLANTGSGGRLIAWSDFVGFRTTSIIGLHMAPVEQDVQTLGNGKQIHRGVRNLTRDFTITGRIFAHDTSQLFAKHNALQALLRSNNTSTNDQMIIRYQEVDDNEQLVSPPLDIICIYRDGLQGSVTDLYQMSIAVQFSAVQPHLAEIFESSVELTLVKELVSNMIVFRDEHGEYFNLGTGATAGGVVTRVGFLRDGRPIAFGNFTSLAGSGVASGAVWNGATWVALTGASSGVNDIDDGFRLGYPLIVGTQSGTVEVYDADADSWSVLASGDWLGPIAAVVRDANGDVWIGGDFPTSQTGITTYNNVAHYEAATNQWLVMGTGVTNAGTPAASEVTTVVVPNDGYVYIGGNFTQGVSGATTTFGANVIRWNIETEVYEGMGAGLNDVPAQLLHGRDGYIYAVGPFTEDGTDSYDLRGFARWNGYSWEEVFPLVRAGGVYGADGLAQDNEDIFWFYNTIFTPEDELFDIEGLGLVPFFGWRDGVFYPPYMADGSIRHLALGPGNRAMHAVDAYVGAGTPAKVPAMTRVTYEGSANAPVLVHLEGPGQFNQVRNYSTEGGVYGKNTFVMSASESVVLRNDLQRTLYYSNQRRNLYSRILGGASNMAALRLIPGENRISLLVLDSTAGSEGWLSWKNRYRAIGEGKR